MIKLHVTLWDLVARGAALYVLAVFMIRGQLLKRRWRHELMGPSAPLADRISRGAVAVA